MKNKTVLITGATSGIGKTTAKRLSEMGALVVMLIRNKEKGEAVRKEIQANNDLVKIDIIQADLASLPSVRKAAGEIRNRYRTIDVLINNAGGIFSKRLESKDGYELTFAMNHLGHFLFTNEILDIITKTDGSRIINVSSEGHRMGRLDFEDLMMEKKKYSAIKAYGSAKLANIYFTYELARRIHGSGTTVNVLHPGVVRTNFGNDFRGLWRPLFWISQPFMLSPEKGAETSVYLASSSDVKSTTGKYFKDKKETRSSDISYEETIASQLWEVSEKLVKKTLGQEQ